MKEATGEVSMTMVTIVAIAVIGAILALLWDPITDWIQNSFGTAAENTAGDRQNNINGGWGTGQAGGTGGTGQTGP